MTTERAYLLERCLRLEAEIVALNAERVADWPRVRFRRVVEDEDRAQMRALLDRGLSYGAVGRQLGWHRSTVKDHTETRA